MLLALGERSDSSSVTLKAPTPPAMGKSLKDRPNLTPTR
jgi:hypothetical protein